MAGIPFRLYITIEDVIIGIVLTQVMEGKEHIITYFSRCLIDAETRYSFIESCVYLCSMLDPNYGIICYLALE
jgi:hypothetical protein